MQEKSHLSRAIFAIGRYDTSPPEAIVECGSAIGAMTGDDLPVALNFHRAVLRRLKHMAFPAAVRPRARRTSAQHDRPLRAVMVLDRAISAGVVSARTLSRTEFPAVVADAGYRQFAFFADSHGVALRQNVLWSIVASGCPQEYVGAVCMAFRAMRRYPAA
jgi:hypothetical protein